MYDAHIYDPRSLILMHVCMYGACIYDAIFFGNGPTDERTDKAILGVGCQMFKDRLIAQNMALKGTFFRCLIESEKIPFELFNILC